MDSLYQSLSDNQYDFYPTEYATMGCKKEPNTGEVYDPRYTFSGFYWNQYDLRNDVNILPMMKRLPSYYRYGPNDIDL